MRSRPVVVLVFVVAAVACDPSPSSAPTAAASSIALTAPAVAGPPVREVFERVLEPVVNDSPAVYAAGPRSLVVQNGRFVGYAQRRGRFVRDDSLAAGLPEPHTPETGDAVLLVAGRFPNVGTVFGHFAGSGETGAYFVYEWRGKAWARADRRVWDRPWSLAPHRGGWLLFDPPGFYLVDGMTLAPKPGEPADPCAPRGQRTFGALIGSASRAPRVDERFFGMGVAADGDGNAMTWGYVACEPGAYAGAIDGDAVRPTRLPGTEGCTDRDPTNGLPLVTASLFPAADGGAYALVGADLRIDEQGVPYLTKKGEASKPCAGLREPLRLRRGRTGFARYGPPLPMPAKDARTLVHHSAIDPTGTAFLLTKRGTVLRVDSHGSAEELGLTKACAKPPAEADAPLSASIIHVEAPAPDDVWVVVEYGDRIGRGLCRARL